MTYVIKNGRKFSAEFNKATVVNGETRLLSQTPGQPVEYVDIDQIQEVTTATISEDITALGKEVADNLTATEQRIDGKIGELRQEVADNYAKQDGEYKELTAGFAERLVGIGTPVESAFLSYTPTTSGAMRITKIYGNSVAENGQILDCTATAISSNGIERALPDMSQMHSAINVRDVYDLEAGTLTKTVGVVELDSLSWSYLASIRAFYTTVPNIKPSTRNVLAANYVIRDGGVIGSAPEDMIMSVHGGGLLRMRNLSCNGDVNAFMNAIAGEKIYFELASATTSSVDVHPIDIPIERNLPISLVFEGTIAPIVLEEIITPSDSGVTMNIPNTITVAEGDTIRIYHKNIINIADEKSVFVEILCDVGKSFPDYYELDATSDNIGAHQLVINVYSGVHKSTSTTTINVIATPSSPTSNKNILMVGDSIMADGLIANELKRRLTLTSGDGTPANPTGLGLTNISFVGRKDTSYNIQQEATGGWGWITYTGLGGRAFRFYVEDAVSLNVGAVYTTNGYNFTIQEINVTGGIGNIRCTYSTGSPVVAASGTLTKVSGSGDATITYTSHDIEAVNPFWNDDVVDFTNYANLYCNGSIDLVCCYVGINDLFNLSSSVEDIMAMIKVWCRAYHTDFPSGKMLIASLVLPSPNGGMGASYNASATSYYTISQRIRDYADALNALVEDAEFAQYVALVPALPLFDSDNLYPTQPMAVALRLPDITEERGTNGVHPLSEGKLTIADAFFPKILENL